VAQGDYRLGKSDIIRILRDITDERAINLEAIDGEAFQIAQ
jgi:hypothetical protein